MFPSAEPRQTYTRIRRDGGGFTRIYLAKAHADAYAEATGQRAAHRRMPGIGNTWWVRDLTPTLPAGGA